MIDGKNPTVATLKLWIKAQICKNRLLVNSGLSSKAN